MATHDPIPAARGPSPADPATTIARIYEHRFDERSRRDRERLWRTLCDAYFARYVPERGVVLDLGAGHGGFINAARAAHRVALDIDPATAGRLDPGVEFVHAPMDRLANHLEPGSVDLAFASNVFEHLPDAAALLATLDAVRTVLRPGGRLLILQPNIRAVGPAFWDFLDHTLPLTELGMAEALRVAGFQVECRRTRFLPYSTRGRLPSWPWLVRLYLRLPPAWYIFGKQMFIVARRPKDDR